MTVSQTLRSRVLKQAGNCCGYCRVPGAFVYAPMEIEHILPKVAGGTDEEGNLWLSCPRCNGFKAAKTRALDPRTRRVVPLFNPRLQVWSEHFRWGKDRTTIIGRTSCGRATVDALHLNFEASLELRRWLLAAGVYPPDHE
jgi:hypothetical protein